MRSVSATEAKQRLAALLDAAQREPRPSSATSPGIEVTEGSERHVLAQADDLAPWRRANADGFSFPALILRSMSRVP